MKQNTFFPFLPCLLFGFVFCFDPQYEACPPTTTCGRHNISYPFFIGGVQNRSCGHPRFEVNCTNNEYATLHIPENDYVIDEFFYNNSSFRVHNAVATNTSNCLPLFRNTTFDDILGYSNNSVTNVTLFSNCPPGLVDELSMPRVGCGGGNNGSVWESAMFGNDSRLANGRAVCRVNVVAPVDVYGSVDGVGEMMRRGFVLNYRAGECGVCEASGGRCGFNSSVYQFRCFCRDGRLSSRLCWPRPPPLRRNNNNLRVILSTVISGGFVIVICMLIILIYQRYNLKCIALSSSRNSSTNPRLHDDLEGCSIGYGVPVFSYTELEEATNNFDPSKELGDGGYGTVYHGKLRDGREVAVKRLYEHNFKRMQQFMNEVQMLTRLRHRNLVLLYGCTSRRSRELLLVYEYIPNGTIADHLHGDRAKTGSLTWPIRMNIAIETARALAYLHASDIIHRDVKTTNILLDSNFCVKVADFGLSRLLPNDVTHVSTAPQGTPGYVDPEYHTSYQLTDKSDVYSFGVVLIELLSSMPAVDISRNKHEINLANLAINKIQKRAFNDLIDKCLGFDSDDMVARMTVSVAGLAFRCLQLEKEMRPTMSEVLQDLKDILKGDEEKIEKIGESGHYWPPPSPECEEDVLLKSRIVPPSPDTVTYKWVSSSSNTTPNISV